MATKLKRVEIKRSRWLRNTKNEDYAVFAPDSKLRIDNGKQCCLGFLVRAEGYKASDIANVSLPSDVDSEEFDFLTEKMAALNPVEQDFERVALERNIAYVNDSPDYTDKQRERLITKLFKQAGYRAVFVD